VDENVSKTAFAECYSAESDVQNAVIIDVTTTGGISSSNSSRKNSTSDTKSLVTINSKNVDEVDSDFSKEALIVPTFKDVNVTKNREELLKAIRESLSDKLADDKSDKEVTKSESSVTVSSELKKVVNVDTEKVETHEQFVSKVPVEKNVV